MLLLDTHILVWLDQGSEYLGRKALRLIERAHQEEEIAVASISFWEVAMLIEQNRLSFSGDLSEWRVSLLNSGFHEVSFDGAAVLTASSLPGFQGDPADRLISAAALQANARLVTADERLLSQRGLRTVNGTS